MKSLKLTLLALTFLTLGLSSCKKNSDNTPKASNSISFKFNGTAYTTSTITAAYSKGALQIIGTVNTTTTMYLAIPSGVKAGSFDFSTGTAGGTFNTSATNAYFADSGTLTITSFTGTTVAGTFSFSGTNISNGSTCTVTSGTFSTSYTTQ